MLFTSLHISQASVGFSLGSRFSSCYQELFCTLTNLWKLFHYSPKKAEAFKEIQSALNMLELKVVKPSDTRWLSHERCLRAICKELPALITTLHHLCDISGDVKVYGLVVVLSSFCDVASIDSRPTRKLNSFMQRQAADFSRLPLIIDSIEKELKLLKDDGADWRSEVTSIVKKL